MALAIVQSAKYQTSSATGTATVALSTPTAGNLLLAEVAWSYATTVRTLTTPTGWTLIDSTSSAATNNNALATLYKVSAGTETSNAFVISNAGDYMSAVVYEISGQDATTPINAHAIAQSGSFINSIPTPSVTPSVANTMAFPTVTTNNSTTNTLPAGWALDYDAASSFHSSSTGHSTTAPTSGSALTVSFSCSAFETNTAAMVVIAPSSAVTGALSVGLKLGAQPAVSGALTLNEKLTGAAVATGALTVSLGLSAVPVASLRVNLGLTAQVSVAGALTVNLGLTGATPTPTGALTVGLALAGSVTARGALTVTVGLLGTTTVPRPSHKVEVAFVNDPYGTLVWTDVTLWATDFDTKRGKNAGLGTPEAGTATVTLWNIDGRFDPGNTSSPYYPYVLPRRPIRVTTTLAGLTYNVWRGFVERWPQTYKMSGAYTEVVVTATDAFTNVLTAKMPPRFGDVIVTDLDIANGHGAYWPMQDAAGTTGTGAATAASYKFADTNPATIGATGAVATFVSGSLRSAAAGFFMRTTWNASGTVTAKTSPGSSAINGAIYGFEMLFRVQTADTNTTHPSIQLLHPGTSGSGLRALFFVHSATASSGYKLIIGVSAGSGSSVPSSTTATYGDLTLGTAYHLAWVPVTGGGYKVYVNGVVFYDGSADATFTLGGQILNCNSTTVTSLVVDIDDVVYYTQGSISSPPSLGQLTPTMVGTHYALTGLSGVPQADYPSQLTSARVNAVLDSVGWPAGQRVIDTGLSTLAASGSVQNRTALDLILEATTAELGNVFIDGQGRLVFQNRTHRNGAAVAITFGDTATGAGEVPYLGDVVVEFDEMRILNDITIAQSLGTSPQTAIRGDAASQKTYGTQSYNVSVPLLNAADCDGMADTILSRYKDPHQRVETVTVELSSSTGLANAAAVLARDIGDVARFRRRPPGGAAIDINNGIEGIQTRFTAATGQLAVTFQLDVLPANATY